MKNKRAPTHITNWIKKQVNWINKQVNWIILLISFGLGLILSGSLIISASGKSRQALYLLSKFKFSKSAVNLIGQAISANSNQAVHGILLIIFGFIILILIACILASKGKIGVYIFWTLISIFWFIPNLALYNLLDWPELILFTTWFCFSIIWLIKKLYFWTIKDKDTMLAKLTFLWGIVAVVLSMIIKG